MLRGRVRLYTLDPELPGYSEADAAQAIAAGKCTVALITLAGRPRAEGMATGTVPRSRGGTPTRGCRSPAQGAGASGPGTTTCHLPWHEAWIDLDGAVDAADANR